MSFLASGPYYLRRLCLYLERASRTTSSTRRNHHHDTYPAALSTALSAFLNNVADSLFPNHTSTRGYPFSSADRHSHLGSPRKSKLRNYNASTLSYGALFFSLAFCITLYQDYDILSQTSASRTAVTSLDASSNHTDANVAFFVQTYSKTIHLLPALLEVVWHPDNIYAVHIDAEVPDPDMQATRELLQDPKYANVLLMPREHVTYLGITTLLGTIDAMSFLLKQDKKWDYFINLSGADYPLLRPARIRALLGQPDILAQRLNFIQAHNDPAVVRAQVYESRFDAMWVDTALWLNLAHKRARATETAGDAQTERCRHGCLWKSDASAHPLLLQQTHGQLPIVKTEAWVILHRGFVEHVVESPTSRRLLAILTNMACPEEFFFGTLLQLSDQFRNSTVFDAFRCVLWTHKRYKGSRPPELDSGRVANVTGILRASGAMFARKMMKHVSPVKAYVDAELMGLWNSDTPGVNGVTEPMSEVYRATVERRVRCMVQLRWRWRSKYARYVECMGRS